MRKVKSSRRMEKDQPPQRCLFMGQNVVVCCALVCVKADNFFSKFFFAFLSVGVSSYDLITFRSCSKHVAWMLISTFCPVTHFFLACFILEMECFGMHLHHHKTNNEVFQRKRVWLSRALLASDTISFFSTVPHYLLMCAAPSTSLRSCEKPGVRRPLCSQLIRWQIVAAGVCCSP